MIKIKKYWLWIGISVVVLIAILLVIAANGNTVYKEENNDFEVFSMHDGDDGVEQLIQNKYERDYVLGLQEYNIGYIDLVPKSILVPVPLESDKYRYLSDFDFLKLYHSLVEFYDESVREFVDFEYAIPILATKKYISILAHFRTNEKVPPKGGASIKTCVTIDLEQKKEVFLCDLIDVNDKFIQLVKDGKLARNYEPEVSSDFVHASDFSKSTKEEIRQQFDDCSRPTPKDDSYKKNPHDGFAKFNKPSFYLAPNQICFVNFGGRRINSTFCISLDDIEEFLKVDKW